MEETRPFPPPWEGERPPPEETMLLVTAIADEDTTVLEAGGLDVDAITAEEEELAMVDVKARVIAKGFTDTQLTDTISEYENMGVLVRTANNTRLRFVNADED